MPFGWVGFGLGWVLLCQQCAVCCGLPVANRQMQHCAASVQGVCVCVWCRKCLCMECIRVGLLKHGEMGWAGTSDMCSVNDVL